VICLKNFLACFLKFQTTTKQEVDRDTATATLAGLPWNRGILEANENAAFTGTWRMRLGQHSRTSCDLGGASGKIENPWQACQQETPRVKYTVKQNSHFVISFFPIFQ